MLELKGIDNKDRDYVIGLIKENWGSSLIVTKGNVHDTEGLPGFVAKVNGEIRGIVTYSISNQDCEIVSLDSMLENQGIGSALINKVIDAAKNIGCKRVWLITTNDNINALRYYQKRGFNLVAVYRNAMDLSREIKPQIPLKGFEDIPILHEIELEKLL